jgi:hypothetical protein
MESKGRHLALSKTVYFFRCGESGLYALTTDPTGHILPSRIYPRVRWCFERPLTLPLNKTSPIRDFVKTILDTIAKYGFYLTHALAIQAELLAVTVQHDDEGIEMRRQ